MEVVRNTTYDTRGVVVERVVRVPASKKPVPGRESQPGATQQCALRGGRSHCNTVQIMLNPRPWWAVKKLTVFCGGKDLLKTSSETLLESVQYHFMYKLGINLLFLHGNKLIILHRINKVGFGKLISA